MRRGVLFIAFALAVACTSGTPEPDSDGTWVGTITTEGSVTTVVNESGSVWGGVATLVEELSIGVDRGEPPYMFGQVASIWATDESIYVVDAQVPAVHVYDRQGRYLRDIGRPGQGPGEYQRPGSVAVLPDGRVLVREYSSGTRIGVYSAQGETLDTWYGEMLFGMSTPPVVSYDGEYFTQTLGATPEEREQQKAGMARAGADGIEGPLRLFPQLEEPRHPDLRAGNASLGIPLWPGSRAVMLPSGAMVAGVADQHRLVMDRPDGTRLVIERPIDPLPVSDEEWEWHRRRMIARGRGMDPSFDWSGDGLPRTHPAFTALLADRSRRIWVLRPARIIRETDCTEDPLDESSSPTVPCFTREDVADVFDEESGKLLGEVAFPSAVHPADLSVPFIRGTELYTAVEDAAGTIMVKRYRLVLPEEEQ